jgi:hypothetical protein
MMVATKEETMEAKAPPMMMPAVIAGGSLGFLSGLPLSSCACCLWATGAGFLAAFLYSRSCRTSGVGFDAGRGGVLGLLTGAVFGVVGAVIGSVVTMMTGGLDPEAMRQGIESNPMVTDPEAAEQFIHMMESAGPFLFVLVIALIWLIMGVLFAALGGLIGGAAFKVGAADRCRRLVRRPSRRQRATTSTTDGAGRLSCPEPCRERNEVMEYTPPDVPVSLPIIPWEDPSRSSFDGLFETVKLLATRPGEAFQRMPTTGGIGRPLFYAIVIGWVSIAIGVFWNVLLQGMWMPFMKSMEDAAGMGAAYGLTVGWGLLMVVLAPLFVIIGVFIAAAVLHLMLLILGGAQAGFEATVRVVCYTQTAQLAGIVPFCGGIIALVWTVVLYVLGFATAHRTSQGKALLAVLLPAVLCCAFAVFVVVLVGGIAGLAASR